MKFLACHAVGMVPVMSRYARRTKTASEQSLGWMFIVLSLAKTILSIWFAGVAGAASSYAAAPLLERVRFGSGFLTGAFFAGSFFAAVFVDAFLTEAFLTEVFAGFDLAAAVLACAVFDFFTAGSGAAAKVVTASKSKDQLTHLRFIDIFPPSGTHRPVPRRRTPVLPRKLAK